MRLKHQQPTHTHMYCLTSTHHQLLLFGGCLLL